MWRGRDKNIDLVFDGLFEILAAYFQCVRVNAIGNDEDLASRRIGTQPGQDANRVAGSRQRQFSDNDSRIDLIDEMRMLNQHVARQVENTAFERAPKFLLKLIEGGAIRHHGLADRCLSGSYSQLFARLVDRQSVV